MPGEEVKIVAVMDTTDVANGINRIAASTQKIQQILQTQLEGTGDGADQVGQNVGTRFMNGMLKRILLRDAIMTIIRGMGEIMEQGGRTLGDLLGTNIDLSLKGTLDRIGQTLGNFVVMSSSLLRQASEENTLEDIDKINAQEKSRIQLEKEKENPLLLKKSTQQIQNEIEQSFTDEANSKKDFDDKKYEALRFHDISFDEISETAETKAKVADIGEKRRVLEQELEIAKKRDELRQKEKDKESGAISMTQAMEIIHKQDEAAAEAFKKKKALEKKEEHHVLAEDIADEEKQKRTADVDLSYTRRLLEHQHATSAVMINGGLFGRNDSAAALVQTASQQLAVLRSIDLSLKKNRESEYQLTLQ